MFSNLVCEKSTLGKVTAMSAHVYKIMSQGSRAIKQAEWVSAENRRAAFPKSYLCCKLYEDRRGSTVW